MSEWFYIRLAFGLTWVVLGGYLFLLHRRRRAAEQGIHELGGGDVS